MLVFPNTIINILLGKKYFLFFSVTLCTFTSLTLLFLNTEALLQFSSEFRRCSLKQQRVYVVAICAKFVGTEWANGLSVLSIKHRGWSLPEEGACNFSNCPENSQLLVTLSKSLKLFGGGWRKSPLLLTG